MLAQNNQQALNLQVTEGLTVAVLQDSNHEFLMTTEDVAFGYGVAPNSIRSHKSRNKEELIENVHFISVAICDTPLKSPRTLWTKAGVIRLGMFLKSERAKVFRDWAEKVILSVTAPAVKLPEAPKRKHNRLSEARLIDILVDVAQIEDDELRVRIVNKLTGKEAYNG